MRRMFGSSSAMRTIGTYVLRSCGDLLPGGICRASPPRPSERSLVVNRWPSVMRSTSIAIESSACSIRSRRSVTSRGSPGFLASASIRRDQARASGIPMAQMMAVANAPRGTTISGPISGLPNGVPAVSRYRELNLGSFTQRAGGVHGSIVRPHRLSRNGESQSCPAGLVGDVGLPDLFQTVGRDSFSGVGNRYAHRGPAAHSDRARLDGDSSAGRGCIYRVQKNVAQSAGKRAVMSVYPRQILVYLQVEGNAGWNAAARRVSNELAHVDCRCGAIGQSAELREASRHAIEPLGFDSDYFDIFLKRLRGVPAQACQRE